CRQFAKAYKSSEDPTAKSKNHEAFQKCLPQIKNFEKSLYGDAFEVKKWPANTNLRQVVDSFSRNPGYYMLSFRRPTGGGHVVGFEIRADIVVSENFPALYEFLDANLGLFAFGKYDGMLSFFLESVWQSLYSQKYAVCTFRTAQLQVAPGV